MNEKRIWKKRATEKRLKNIQKRLKSVGIVKGEKIFIGRESKFRRLIFFIWYGSFIVLLCALTMSVFYPEFERFEKTVSEVIKTGNLDNEEPRNDFKKIIKSTPSYIYVVDADTIAIRDIKVRFSGISADEKGSPSYDACKLKVAQIISGGSEVICYMSGKMTYDREVGDCYIINKGLKEDIQRLVIQSGCARDCPRYSGGYYGQFEVEDSKKLNLPNYCR